MPWRNMRSGTKLGKRERAMGTWGYEEVLAVRCHEDRVEAAPGAPRLELEPRAVRQHAVHSEPGTPEVVARRIEDDEVEARGRLVHPIVSGRVGAPEERVVERVEVRALRNRGALRIDHAVGARHVVLEPRRG